MEPQTRHPAGVFREEQVWIGSRLDSPVGAEFVPPHHSRVPGLIEDLSKFVEHNDVPVMAAVAISHAQF
jgi:Fic family protein